MSPCSSGSGTYGYHDGGQAHRFFNKGCILLEEEASDSLQNLLLSILLFRRITKRYTSNIQVITYAFKARRFLQLYAAAIQWPKERLHVQGIHSAMSSRNLEITLPGEELNGYGPWKNDPLGMGHLLRSKQKSRGWSDLILSIVGQDLEDSVKMILQGVITKQLPWATDEHTDTPPTSMPINTAQGVHPIIPYNPVVSA